MNLEILKLKEINNMKKKKICLFFVHDEILEQKVVIYIIKYIKKTHLYLMSILYIAVGHVHIVRMIIYLIGTCS